jgi:hypothetical protein
MKFYNRKKEISFFENNIINESFDIDIIAKDKNNILFGECKWTNKKVGVEVYDKLKLRSEFIKSKTLNKKYAIFSKSGFTQELLNLKNDNLFLFTPEDIENVMFN